MVKKELTDIPGYQGLYAITKDGKVWSYISNKFLSPYTKNGYLIVSLFKNKQQKKWFVHRLLALTFISNPENKTTVDHIDRDTTNNNLNNLRWATQSEQNVNRTRTKKMQEACEKGGKVIERHIECRDKNNHNILINTYPSAYQAAIQKFGDAQKNSLIHRCAKGQKPSAYGYWWKYTEEEK